MKHVKTSAGFEADIDEAVFNDMELFDAIVELDQGNSLALSRVTEKILGKNKAGLYEALRNENGRVPVNAVSEQIREIMLQVGEKNS